MCFYFCELIILFHKPKKIALKTENKWEKLTWEGCEVVAEDLSSAHPSTWAFRTPVQGWAGKYFLAQADTWRKLREQSRKWGCLWVTLLEEAERKGWAGKGSWGWEGICVRCDKSKLVNGGSRPPCEERRFKVPSGCGLTDGIHLGKGAL